MARPIRWILILMSAALFGCNVAVSSSSSSNSSGSEEAVPGSENGSGTGSNNGGMDAYCTDIDFGDQAINEEIYEMCLQVNEERARDGKSPLTIRQDLSDVATAHAKDMHDQGYFSHTGLDGRSPNDRIRDSGISFRGYGENIAAGNGTAEETMNQWMNSSGHRANILRSSFDEIGIGYFGGDRGYRHYWVQKFISN